MQIGVSYTTFHADSKYVIQIFVSRQDFFHFDILWLYEQQSPSKDVTPPFGGML